MIGLTIGLGVIAGCEVDLHSQLLPEVFLKPSDQLRTTVGQQVRWRSMIPDYLLNEKIGGLVALRVSHQGNEVGRFGKSAHDNHDDKMAIRLREARN